MKADLQLLRPFRPGVLLSSLTVADGGEEYYVEILTPKVEFDLCCTQELFRKNLRDKLWHSFQKTLRWNLSIDPEQTESAKADSGSPSMVGRAGQSDIINGQPKEKP